MPTTLKRVMLIGSIVIFALALLMGIPGFGIGAVIFFLFVCLIVQWVRDTEDRKRYPKKV